MLNVSDGQPFSRLWVDRLGDYIDICHQNITLNEVNRLIATTSTSSTSHKTQKKRKRHRRKLRESYEIILIKVWMPLMVFWQE